MSNFNSVVLVGHLTRDPEIRNLESGKQLCRFSLAVNYYGAGDFKETLFIDVVAFGKTADTVGKYVKKGDPLLVSGRLKLNTWEKDGQKMSRIEVVCDRMQMLTSKKGKDGQLAENDIPF